MIIQAVLSLKLDCVVSEMFEIFIIYMTKKGVNAFRKEMSVSFLVTG